MKPVDRAELSALLDGELSPLRAEEVRRALVADPELARVYDELRGVDVELKGYAAAVAFRPRLLPIAAVQPTPTPAWSIVLGFLALRTFVKFLPTPLAVALQLTALAFVLAWLLVRLLRAADHEQTALRQRMLNAVQLLR